MRARTYRSRGLTAAVAAVASLTLLAACGGTSTPASGPPSTSSPSPSSVPTAPTMQPPAPTPTPSPTPLLITSDDLTDALPTNPMLSKVQGYTFKENKEWTGGTEEGPEWVADAPLTKEQARQVGLGWLRRVKPDTCEAKALFVGNGWTKRWSTGDYVEAVGYAKKVNSYAYWKTGLLDSWQSVAYVLTDGAAAEWVRNVRATTKACAKYTLITAGGDVEKVNTSAGLKDWRETWRQSGTAVVNVNRVAKSGRAAAIAALVEPIGRVLYYTVVTIKSDDDAQWARASALYNRLADSIAKVQGIERESVDLLGGTAFTPNPDEYQAPTPPGNTMA